MYKKSRFNLSTIYGDKHLLYNQVSGALIALDEEEIKALDTPLSELPSDFLEPFIDGSFVIEQKLDEIDWLYDYAQKMAYVSTEKQLTIAPTDQCNLNCPYCFENKDQWIKMDEATQEQTKIFVKNFVEATPTKSLNVTWFGGEPTLHMKAIENLTKYFDSLGVNTNYSMITNGTNLNKNYVDRLSELKCKNLQITIDGIKEQHDASRPFRKTMSLTVIKENKESKCGGGGCGKDDNHAKSSFDKIVASFQYLWESGFVIDLRVNVGKSNANAFYDISKMIDKLGYNRQSPAGGLIVPYPSKLFLNENAMTHEEFINGHPQYYGLKRFNGKSCTANKNFSFGISQNGKLTKCWEHITNEQHLIGTVWDLNMARKGFFDNYSPAKDPICKDCEVLATCWGGCRSLNENFDKGYDGVKYEGCGRARWDAREQIKKMYIQSLKQ